MSHSVRLFEGAARWWRGSLAAGLLGLIGWVAGLFVDARHALFSLLTAYAWLATTLLGALALLMVLHASRAEWPLALRRLIEGMVGAIPMLTALFVPLALGLSRVYVWASPEKTEGHLAATLHHQGAWWNPGFFFVRAALYFATWLLFAELLRRWSLRQDRDGALAWAQKSEKLSGFGLVILSFTLTFAAFDWLMSLTPTWFSSVFGIYVFAGGFVAALAVTVVLAARAKESGLLAAAIGRGHFLSLGKLLFAQVIFWAYIAFSQYFIVWIANVPREASWWEPRSAGWKWASLLLAAIHFAVPFAVLLSRDLKKHPGRLSLVSGWLLVAHYLDVYWLVMPAYSPERPRPHWMDLAALALVVGAALALALWRARGVPVAPVRAPGFAVSVRYEGT